MTSWALKRPAPLRPTPAALAIHEGSLLHRRGVLRQRAVRTELPGHEACVDTWRDGVRLITDPVMREDQDGRTRLLVGYLNEAQWWRRKLLGADDGPLRLRYWPVEDTFAEPTQVTDAPEETDRMDAPAAGLPLHMPVEGDDPPALVFHPAQETPNLLGRRLISLSATPNDWFDDGIVGGQVYTDKDGEWTLPVLRQEIWWRWVLFSERPQWFASCPLWTAWVY